MLKRNLAANYVGTAFVAAAQVLVIPLYLRFLGGHDWGLLSSLLALAATLLILEAGVSQAVARGIAENGARAATIDRSSFEGIERRYLALTLGGSALLALFSARLGSLLLPQADTDATGFALAAITMAAAQIVGSLYRGALVGHGSQVRLNAIIVAGTLVRHTLGLTLAAQGHGAISVAAALAGSFVLEAVARRWMVARLLSTAPVGDDKASSQYRPSSSRGALVLAAAGTVGALATQLDRLVLGASISAVDLGRYAIAATLSLAMLQLIYPISNALMPHLNDFQHAAASRRLLTRSYRLLLVILVPLWGGAALLATEGLQRWLPHVGNADVAAVVAPLFLIHLVGTTFNALCVPLHLALLAGHLDRRILVSNVVGLCTLLAALATLVPHYGTTAGSLAWALGNAALLIVYFAMYQSRPEHR